MKTKKSLMGLAAILILLFHFWMPLTASPIEVNLYRSTYWGVDIFFFVSAYSLSQRKHISWLQFVGNRLIYVYVPFAVMAVIAAIYKGWSFSKLVKTLVGVSFFKTGGGSFLWFAIAIMLIYLIAPGMPKLKDKFGYWSAAMVLVAWLLLVCVLQFGFGYTTIFILLNRIPIMVVGYFYDDLRKLFDYKYTVWGITAVLIAGALLVYNFGGSVKLNKPIAEIYYLIAIPFTVAFIMLTDYIASRTSFSNKPLSFIGGFTLELYGMQMIFGYDIESKVFKLLKQTAAPLGIMKLVSFVVTICLLILISWIFANIKKFIIEYIKKINNK